MKFCYVDETGTGTEPIAVMAGIVVDAGRMHVTKGEWRKLLDDLSSIVGKRLQELHTRDFYAGGGVWKPLDGPARSAYIDSICDWLLSRKHDIVFSSVQKSEFDRSRALHNVPSEVSTYWRFLGMHLILSMQRCFQGEPRNKGNTIFVFDNEEREQMRFTDLVLNSPAWSFSYYGKGKKQEPLDQIVDVPYFGDSKEVGLLQLADFVAFFLRKYAELKSGLVEPKYDDELVKVEAWVKKLASRCVGRTSIYPRTGRCSCADLFYSLAPEPIRNL